MADISKQPTSPECDELVARLRHAITTAHNDDLSEPMSDKRQRHIDRVSAMDEAITFISVNDSFYEMAMQTAERAAEVVQKQGAMLEKLRASEPADNTLLTHLPKGDIQYVRAPSGAWDVAIFETSTPRRVATIAHNMDKGVAAWVAQALSDARAML